MGAAGHGGGREEVSLSGSGEQVWRYVCSALSRDISALLGPFAEDASPPPSFGAFLRRWTALDFGYLHSFGLSPGAPTGRIIALTHRTVLNFGCAARQDGNLLYNARTYAALYAAYLLYYTQPPPMAPLCGDGQEGAFVRRPIPITGRQLERLTLSYNDAVARLAGQEEEEGLAALDEAAASYACAFYRLSTEGAFQLHHGGEGSAVRGLAARSAGARTSQASSPEGSPIDDDDSPRIQEQLERIHSALCADGQALEVAVVGSIIGAKRDYEADGDDGSDAGSDGESGRGGRGGRGGACKEDAFISQLTALARLASAGHEPPPEEADGLAASHVRSAGALLSFLEESTENMPDFSAFLGGTL